MLFSFFIKMKNLSYYTCNYIHNMWQFYALVHYAAAATTKSLQSCLTVWSHRRQPTRLPRPWDSPGKNTGVGCHFLLQCMKVKIANIKCQELLNFHEMQMILHVVVNSFWFLENYCFSNSQKFPQHFTVGKFKCFGIKASLLFYQNSPKVFHAFSFWGGRG